MLVAAISTIIIAGIFGILQASNKQLEMIHARMSLQEGPREALFKMAQEIRQAPLLVDANRVHITEDSILTVNMDEILDAPEGENGVQQAGKIAFSVPNAATLIVNDQYEPAWMYDVQYTLDEDTHQILRISKNIFTLEKKQTILANEVIDLKFSRKKTSAPGLITITASAQRELPDGTKIPDEPIQMIAQAEMRNP